ncbi:MAG: hypothetical protein U5J82_00495 [Desulfobacterales bacterium]|nr:hypothetical protein [Desulfobacterales bacterium]
MRPSFHPRLVNSPFDDPVLFIPFLLQKRAVLFDLGDLHALAPRDILKISHVFVSHTHMDHFVGFDHLLRLFLGREKHLCLFGPPGFLTNVEGKLSGYTWNLVQHYTNRFVLEVSEIHPQVLLTRRYRVQDGFRPGPALQRSTFDGTLPLAVRLEPDHRPAALDHRIPSLAFVLQERFHVNIRRDRLDSIGANRPGNLPWRFEHGSFLPDGSRPRRCLRSPRSSGRWVPGPLCAGELAARSVISHGKVRLHRPWPSSRPENMQDAGPGP